jgi:enediyne biosynthesis protein E4
VFFGYSYSTDMEVVLETNAHERRRSTHSEAGSSLCGGSFAIIPVWLSLVALLFLSTASTHAQTTSAATPGSLPGNFVDMTGHVGIHFLHQAPHSSHKYLIETMGSGVALFDADNDGRLDIFLANGAPFGDLVPKGTIPQKTNPLYWNRFYHQKQDGTFEDWTEKAGLQGAGYGMGAAVGDYDNDGYEDIYVTAYGGNQLFHNNGDGTFTDVTQKSGVGGSGWSTSAAWIDLDGDGRLDLVVARYIQWDWDDLWCGEHREGYRSYCHPDSFQPISMLVYHNDGNGVFTEEAHALGLDKPAKALGLAMADYDHDGHPALFVANDSMDEFLFHRKRTGGYEEVGLDAGIAVDADGRTYAGMGVDFSDYNNDGMPDLLVTDLANQKYSLYRNGGDGTFSYESYVTGVAASTLLHSGWGLRFMDYDNDGWKDLLIAQGHDLDTIEKSYPQLHYREPPMLLRNVDGKRFIDVGPASGEVFAQRWVGRGMAVGDINNDGRLDAVITENGGPAHLLMNETNNAHHWIGFKLVGHRSNRDGIGASIRIDTSKGAQWYTVTTASSYLSSSDVRAHFGLGPDTRVKTVQIVWPSGYQQTLNDVQGDRYVTVEEPPVTQGSK